MLFLIFSVLVANPKNLPYTVTNPTPRGLLNRDMHVQYVRRYGNHLLRYFSRFMDQPGKAKVASPVCGRWTGKMNIERA